MSTLDKIIIVCASLCIGWGLSEKYSQPLCKPPVVAPVVEPIVPLPVPVPAPLPPAPKPEPSYPQVFFDEYDKVLSIAKEKQKRIIVIFSADWCPHCQDLKKDLTSMSIPQQYLLCIIDIDKNKALVNKFNISGLPTTIAITSNEKELCRKSGYQKKSYEAWLYQCIK
jgi:thiol-disulfide isomerase/thioredoxin